MALVVGSRQLVSAIVDSVRRSASRDRPRSAKSMSIYHHIRGENNDHTNHGEIFLLKCWLCGKCIDTADTVTVKRQPRASESLKADINCKCAAARHRARTGDRARKSLSVARLPGGQNPYSTLLWEIEGIVTGIST